MIQYCKEDAYLACMLGALEVTGEIFKAGAEKVA